MNQYEVYRDYLKSMALKRKTIEAEFLEFYDLNKDDDKKMALFDKKHELWDEYKKEYGKVPRQLLSNKPLSVFAKEEAIQSATKLLNFFQEKLGHYPLNDNFIE